LILFVFLKGEGLSLVDKSAKGEESRAFILKVKTSFCRKNAIKTLYSP